jgi:hypothetical protein
MAFILAQEIIKNNHITPAVYLDVALGSKASFLHQTGLQKEQASNSLHLDHEKPTVLVFLNSSTLAR